jgi:hypothetical protein
LPDHDCDDIPLPPSSLFFFLTFFLSSYVSHQVGQDNAAIKEMRTLLRRFPDFQDMRAALAAALWAAGAQAQAEEEWSRVEDPRYRDEKWLEEGRRWPPRLAADLGALLRVADVVAAPAPKKG